MKKNETPWSILLLAILAVLCPLLLDWFIFGNNVPSSLTNGEWASFLGSYLGAVIGGGVSLTGIVMTIRFTKQENEIERSRQGKLEKKAQEKELHQMVAELDYFIMESGEAFLLDLSESLMLERISFSKFEQANYKMLKEANKLQVYAELRAQATSNEKLCFQKAFESIGAYANQLIDVAERINKEAKDLHSCCEREAYQDAIAKEVSKLRDAAEKTIWDYAMEIVK